MKSIQFKTKTQEKYAILKGREPFLRRPWSYQYFAVKKCSWQCMIRTWTSWWSTGAQKTWIAINCVSYRIFSMLLRRKQELKVIINQTTKKFASRPPISSTTVTFQTQKATTSPTKLSTLKKKIMQLNQKRSQDEGEVVNVNQVIPKTMRFQQSQKLKIIVQPKDKGKTH